MKDHPLIARGGPKTSRFIDALHDGNLNRLTGEVRREISVFCLKRVEHVLWSGEWHPIA